MTRMMCALALTTMALGCTRTAPSSTASVSPTETLNSTTTPQDKERPTMANKTILMAVSSHSELGDEGKKTGTYAPEVAHAYHVFNEAGYAIDFVSTAGGQVPLYGTDEGGEQTAAFMKNEQVLKALHASMTPAQVDVTRYDAIFYAGGHGTMWDFPHDEKLADIASTIYGRGGVVSAVCHGPAGLVNIKLEDGSYLVAGKRVAAFTDAEEVAAGLDDTVPFLLSSKLEERGATMVPAPNWEANIVTSERLVTGQNPASATGTAEAVVDLLSK
jgi:putative intracellular protease/amidase